MTEDSKYSCLSIILGFGLWIIFAGLIGGAALQYDINYWGTYFKGHTVNIPYFPCFIGGLFLSQFAVPICILTWLISYFL